jgi:tRNA U55 pseudouridine synthase TruB
MYVRSLARDIAYDLNTFAFVDCLKRVKIGEFDLKKSIKYNDIGTI